MNKKERERGGGGAKDGVLEVRGRRNEERWRE